MTDNTVKEVAMEIAKSSPPVAVVTASMASELTLGNVLTAVTIIYVILQICWLVWRWYQVARMPAGAAAAVVDANQD